MDDFLLRIGSEENNCTENNGFESVCSGIDNKIIRFPIEEFLNSYNKMPEGFELINVIAQALGGFCFCLTISEILKNIDLIPSFNKPECNFIYVLSDFEKNFINNLTTVRKNKLFSPKTYIADFCGLISGKVYIKICEFNINNIKLLVKFDLKENISGFISEINDLDVIKSEIVENMGILFNSIWQELYPQLHKSQKAYTLKTINYIPDYLKFATAPYIHELRRFMTSDKNKIFAGKESIFAEKVTNSGNYVFKHNYNEEINADILSRLSKMNDLTVDILNGVVHILINKSKRPDMEILISIDDLLFIRGKKASKNNMGVRGGYKDSQRKEVAEHLEMLASLKINVSNTFIPRIDRYGKRNYDSYSGESPVIYLKKHENKDYYYYVKAGETLAVTLAGVGSKTGLIHKKVAEYDYYRNFWEKRIGNYLAWLWRSRQNKSDFLVPVFVETLLSQINEENKCKRPQFIRNRLETALDNLENDGIIRTWQYQSIDESLLKGKNWIEVWLNLKLIIEPPMEIIEEYSKIRKIKKNNFNKANFQEILIFIKDKNLSQLRVAEEIGIKCEVLSGILSGKIPPVLADKRKINNWLLSKKC